MLEDSAELEYSVYHVDRALRHQAEDDLREKMEVRTIRVRSTIALALLAVPLAVIAPKLIVSSVKQDVPGNMKDSRDNLPKLPLAETSAQNDMPYLELSDSHDFDFDELINTGLNYPMISRFGSIEQKRNIARSQDSVELLNHIEQALIDIASSDAFHADFSAFVHSLRADPLFIVFQDGNRNRKGDIASIRPSKILSELLVERYGKTVYPVLNFSATESTNVVTARMPRESLCQSNFSISLVVSTPRGIKVVVDSASRRVEETPGLCEVVAN